MSAARGETLSARWTWWVLVILAVPIALYAVRYLVLGEMIYPPNLVESFRARPWGILPHVAVGSIALLIGPLQFHPGLRTRRPRVHRSLGKVYVIAGSVTGVVGTYMAVYSYGGWTTPLLIGLFGG
jgi:hypothetical protein